MKIWVRLYGEWGFKKYGTKGFHRVDALEFWLDRLFYLRVGNYASTCKKTCTA